MGDTDSQLPQVPEVSHRVLSGKLKRTRVTKDRPKVVIRLLPFPSCFLWIRAHGSEGKARQELVKIRAVKRKLKEEFKREEASGWAEIGPFYPLPKTERQTLVGRCAECGTRKCGFLGAVELGVRCRSEQ